MSCLFIDCNHGNAIDQFQSTVGVSVRWIALVTELLSFVKKKSETELNLHACGGFV